MLGSPMNDESRKPEILLAAAIALAILVFGVVFHPVEAIETAEADQYVRVAEQFTQGRIPKDPYRPLLYPLTAAGLSYITGDTFSAARLVSSLAAAAFLVFTALLARRLLSRSLNRALSIVLLCPSKVRREAPPRGCLVHRALQCQPIAHQQSFPDC